jgi:3-oxoacyl-[acyl-carrier protein] reductase
VTNAGRTALITGCGSPAGIGYATARMLGESGARVDITATTERIHDRVAELCADGIDAHGWVCDLTDPGRAADLVDSVAARTGRLDILVNNAGMVSTAQSQRSAPAAGLADADWTAALDRNLTTAFNVTREALRHMVPRRYGRIIMVASISGPVMAFPNDAGYHAAKAGLVGLTRSVALDYAEHGITCNAVAPGWIGTASSTPDEAAAGDATPVGRPGTADEVAHAITGLAAPLASYVTGQLLVVDGGNSISEVR